MRIQRKLDITNAFPQKLKRKLLFCSFFSLFFYAYSVVLPTWVREKGRSLLYSDLSYRFADEFAVDGRIMPSNDFTEFDWNIYVDHGFTKNYTAGLYFPIVKVLSLASTPTSPSVTHVNKGDIDFIQRYQFASIGVAVFNLEFLMGIPTGNHKEPHGLQTGDGEYNYMPGLSLGWGFPMFSLSSYLTLYSGINFRTEGFSHEWHSSFSWGLFLYKKTLLFSLEAKNQRSLKTEEENTIQNGLWNNTSYLSYGGGITYKFKEESGVSFYYKTLTKIENSLGGDIYSIGVFYIF